MISLFIVTAVTVHFNAKKHYSYTKNRKISIIGQAGATVGKEKGVLELKNFVKILVIVVQIHMNWCIYLFDTYIFSIGPG